LEMNRLQELMVITMEECGELTQVCSKTIRKFNDVDEISEEQREKLIEEAGDVYAMLQLMVHHGLFTFYDLEVRSLEKHKKLETWSKLLDEVTE
jgi:NTP pyrophosphatase (non-canonical NTP hydrolase)